MCRQATIAASQPDVGRRAGWDQQVAISYGSSGGARRESATPAPARIQRRERRGDIVLLEGWQGATPAFPPHCRREKNMRHIGKSQSKLLRGRTDRERNGRPTRAPGRWARPRSAPSPAAARDRPCASSCAPAGDRHTDRQHIRSTIAALPGHPAHHASQHVLCTIVVHGARVICVGVVGGRRSSVALTDAPPLHSSPESATA